MNRLLLLAVVFCFSSSLAAALHADETSLRVLPEEIDGTPTTGLLQAWLVEQAQTLFAARKARYEELKTPEQIADYQRQQREFFVQQLGGWPERTPLNPRVVDSQPHEGYRLERVIFESRPRHDVTAVLYLPPGEGPFPGVLVPCGHSANGKASEAYQRACILLARNGFVTLCYDPIGQGERYQILDEAGKPRFGSTTEHSLVGVTCIPLGLNTASYRIWDGMRALDYLASRPEVDPQRLGCTGNSGGGTLTSYLMALDDRIQCAAPSCYLTGFPALYATIGPQDAEQDIAGQVAFGMDHADYIIMRAPRPTLMCTATRDFFDIGGAWDTFRQAKRIYTRLDRAEAVDLIETDERHGFTTQLRVGAVRWMRRWLQGQLDPIDEPDAAIASDEQLQCSERGQVLLVEGAQSVFDFNRQLEEELAHRRGRRWRSESRDALLREVAALAAIRTGADLPAAQVRQVGTAERDDGAKVDRLYLQVPGEMPLPALMFTPGKPSGRRVLYAAGEGKQRVVGPGGPVDALLAEGATVLAVDLRGLGETAVGGTTRSTSHFGRDSKQAFMAYLQGRPMLGMRAEDVLTAARFLASVEGPGAGNPVDLVATGTAGPAGLHAAALEAGTFGQVRLEESLAAWANVVRTPVSQNQLVNVVHGALRVYDLPDLAATLGDRLTLIDARDGAGQSLATTNP